MTSDTKSKKDAANQTLKYMRYHIYTVYSGHV